jgi:hypothetical protein
LARITAASEVVRRLGAVQAQDYYGAKWAIGLRSSATDAPSSRLSAPARS